MAPKLLLFDIDGTLVRAGGAGRRALNEAARKLYGKDHVCSEFSLAGRTDLWNFATAYRLATGKRPSPRAVEKLYRAYLRLLPRYVSKAAREKTYILPPGIKTLLRRLKREPGVLLGLGTGNLEEGARIKLGPSGFNGYFQFGGFGSDSFHRDRILKKAVCRAARYAGRRIRPRDVFVIGDTPFDVSAGRKAGYNTVAVGTGFATWKELVRSRPDRLARDFRGVAKWLEWFGLAGPRKGG
ncbi:MAG: HAD family hydrolase [Elusimicrobia bacterium]|nr:HAD family hydrolase [Elusimicrobiota bacterium]